jgi:hypothetical protein
LNGEKELNGMKVFQVEGKLAPSRDSVATVITAFFRADNHMPVELHLYNSDGKELRTFRIKDYQTAGGKAYISSTEIENHVYKTRLWVDVVSISFPDKIDDSAFTPQRLREIAKKK